MVWFPWLACQRSSNGIYHLRINGAGQSQVEWEDLSCKMAERYLKSVSAISFQIPFTIEWFSFSHVANASGKVNLVYATFMACIFHFFICVPAITFRGGSVAFVHSVWLPWSYTFEACLTSWVFNLFLKYDSSNSNWRIIFSSGTVNALFISAAFPKRPLSSS